MNENAWQLFCNDQALAEQTLDRAQALESSPRQLALVCQYLTFFGHFERVQSLLLCSGPELLREPYARGALMRIRQYRHHTNPWLSYCPREQKPWFERVCELIQNSSTPIAVELGCGLGDMLETISALHTNTTALKQRVMLVLPDRASAALGPLLTRDQHSHQLAWVTCSDRARTSPEKDLIELPMAVFKAALEQTKRLTRPNTVQAANLKTAHKPTLLCCWRARVATLDPEEKLWAHLRGLDMTSIVRLYRKLMPIAQQHGIQVVDITRYRDHEARELFYLHPSGLSLAAGTLRSFVDTASYFGPNTLVASVDTSLVHLACWCGQRPVMLAHRWPDGRWIQGSWQNVDILEQDTLFNWEPPIQRLIERIRNHAWH